MGCATAESAYTVKENSAGGKKKSSESSPTKLVSAKRKSRESSESTPRSSDAPVKAPALPKSKFANEQAKSKDRLELDDIQISPSQFVVENKDNIYKYYTFKDKLGEGRGVACNRA